NFGGYAGINKSWGYSHIIFSRYDQRLGLVEGERDFTTGQFLLYGGTPIERVATSQELDSRDLFVPQQRVQHNKIIADNNFAFKKNRLKVNLGYQNNIRQEFGNPEDPAEKSLFFDLKTLTYNVQFQLTKIKEWHTTFGVTGMSQANRNKGMEVLIPEYNSFDIGAFLYTQRFFKKSTLSGGFRFDNRAVDSKGFIEGSEIKFTPFTCNFSNISGSVGVSLEPNDNVTIKANIARGFRAPTLAELASNGAHEGTNRYEYGDKDLKSETSFQLDGGIDLDYEHFSFGLAAFYNRMNDFIFYRKLESVSGGDSLVDNGGDFIPAFKFNQNNAMLAGFELSFDLHPHPLDWLHFENSFSFVRGKFDHKIDGNLAGSNNLPLIPAPIWNSELRADFKKAGKLFRNLYSKIEWNKTFKQNNFFSGYGTETATVGYALLNAGIGGDVVKKEKKLFSIYLGVSNLTDVAYQHHLSRLKYASENPVTGRTGVFNTGRNFSIKLNIPLEFSIK
ncbi:MAG: TonB-dependent receptor, partial [Chitinophagaceae bacterium]